MSTTISPLDESAGSVDWWFLYKAPKLAASAQSSATTGYEYVYYDKKLGKVVPSKNKLTSGTGALDSTLKSIFGAKSASLGWVLYNDEMPASAKRADSGSLGHTKGIIAFDLDTKTALWLLHSWPKYADPAAKDALPTPMYGQTYMCLALDLPTASQLAVQMANHQEPQTYLPHLPASLPKTDPLYQLTQPLNPNATGDSDALSFKTRGGQPFKVIAKNRKWGKDFWNDLVGPTLADDLDVETWIRGKVAPILDAGGVYKTYDIKYVDMRPLGAPWNWPEHNDHAKWGITKNKNWVCVGDINRMISQEQRGGGTIALQDEALWTALKKTDLIVPPPGHTDAEARAAIKATHKKA